MTTYVSLINIKMPDLKNWVRETYRILQESILNYPSVFNNLEAPKQPMLAHQLDRVKPIKYILDPSDWQIPPLFMKIPCFMFFVTAV